MADGVFSDNAARKRFEYAVSGHVAHADYRREGQTLYIDYVEAPPELRGTGAAGKLMEKIMETAEREKLSVVPICGYAAQWIRRHKKDAGSPPPHKI
jgi:predicted GNAT family acetyltransferase